LLVLVGLLNAPAVLWGTGWKIECARLEKGRATSRRSLYYH